jgi:hypothetical protein
VPSRRSIGRRIAAAAGGVEHRKRLFIGRIE